MAIQQECEMLVRHSDAAIKAVRHVFQYLEARPGTPLLVYEDSFRSFAELFSSIATSAGLEYSALCASEVNTVELSQKVAAADKCLFAYNVGFAQPSDSTEQLTDLASLHSIKSYTMTDLSDCWELALACDPNDIVATNARLIRILQQSNSMRVTNRLGTDLTILLDPKQDWVNVDCFSEADFDITCSLPAGEVATYSPRVNGVLKFTGALLGTIPIGRKYGLIDDPITVDIVDNAAVNIKCANPALQRDLSFCLHFDSFTHLVNEVAIGTNPSIPQPLKGLNYKYEENQQGFHLGFGASLAQQNVERRTPHHLDFVFSESVIDVDGIRLFDGTFHFESFLHVSHDEPLRIAHKDCCGMFSCIIPRK